MGVDDHSDHIVASVRVARTGKWRKRHVRVLGREGLRERECVSPAVDGQVAVRVSGAQIVRVLRRGGSPQRKRERGGGTRGVGLTNAPEVVQRGQRRRCSWMSSICGARNARFVGPC